MTTRPLALALSLACAASSAVAQAPNAKTRPVTAWLATHAEYRLLAADDLPADVRDGAKPAEIAQVAAVHLDVSGDRVADMAAVLVRGRGADARFSIVCFDGAKGGGYEPEPHWVVRDSATPIAGVNANAPFRLSSGRHPCELLAYDAAFSEPEHRYRWNGSEYEEDYWTPGEGLGVIEPLDLRSAPDAGAPAVGRLGDEDLVVVLEPVAPKDGVRWYKVRTTKVAKGKAGAVGYLPGDKLNPGNG